MTAAATPRLPMTNRADLAPEHVPLWDEISGTRHGMPTSFRVFLNSPGTAEAIASFGKHLRWGVDIPNRAIEIVVMRTAVLTKDDYMWAHHAVLAADAGLSEQDLDWLRTGGSPADGGAADAAVATLVDLTVGLTGTDEEFAAARAVLGDQATLDVIVLTAYYLMLHHVFQVLNIAGNEDTRRTDSELEA